MIAAAADSRPILETRNIFKWFPGGFANDMVDFTLQKAEIHAVLGESGSGKSTLMNIIYGLTAPDSGDILLNGEEVSIRDPRDAIRFKIGMVHQNFMLIPVFTVLENIVLGEERTLGPFLNMRHARNRLDKLVERYGLEIDLDAKIEDLAVGEQQRVEILKALYRDAEILVFDEPTNVLTPQEINALFEVMRQLRSHGISIVFITHKIKEVLAVADRISVMRRGKVVGTTTPAETSETQLANMMVGRSDLVRVVKQEVKPGKTILDVKSLSVANDAGLVAVKSVSFTVSAREIVGVAGVQGNGQAELVEAITGIRPPVSGNIKLLGNDVSKAPPRTITELGTAYVPADRKKDGLVLSFPIADNLTLTQYYKEPYSRRSFLQEEVIEKRALQLMQEYGIEAEDDSVEMDSLNGVNQAKVIIAREFSRPIKLLVASQPTRGLDTDSVEYVHSRLVDKRNEGSGILLVSTDLDEILSLCDRILVMYRGEMVGELLAKEATKEQIGLLMAGVAPETRVAQEVAAALPEV
ncbi:MAG: ABC transporter ATP-binding protein [Anaerolineales bacterium]